VRTVLVAAGILAGFLWAIDFPFRDAAHAAVDFLRPLYRKVTS